MCRRATRGLIVAVLAVAVAGCGFSLRKAGTLPASMAVVQVEVGPDDLRLTKALEAQLIAQGARLAAVGESAITAFRVTQADSGQRVLSVSTTGGPEEYEVFYRARLELTENGERTFGPDVFTLTRDYTFDKLDVLGKRREFEQIRNALADEMASLLVRRAVLAKRQSLAASAANDES